MSELNWRDMHKDATTTLEGEFPVVIVEAAAAKSSNDKDMIKWKAKIESGPYAGRPLWGNFTISPESPGAMRILFSHLAVFGLDGKFFDAHPNAPVHQIAETLIGRKAVAEVGIRQWNGQDREEVKNWKPVTGPGGNQPLGVLGGFAGGSSGIPSGLAGASSTPSTPALAADSPVAFRQGPVPTLRHDTVPTEGAVATEPAVSASTKPDTEPPVLPF